MCRCFFEMPILGSLLVASDVLPESHVLAYQEFCMFETVKLFSGGARSRMVKTKLIAPDTEHWDICAWYGVRCEDKVVTHIDWHDEQSFIASSLRWLPPSVRSLRMSYQGIIEDMLTRLLPKGAAVIDLMACGNFSYIDLGTLPSRTEVFAVVSSGVVGKVNLTSLPAPLRRLDLRHNLIAGIEINNALLPALVIDMRFYNPVKPIPVISAGGEVHDERLQFDAHPFQLV